MSTVEIVSLVLAVFGPVIAWLLADARSKGRTDSLQEKVTNLTKSVDDLSDSLSSTRTEMATSSAVSTTDRAAIHLEILRIAAEKANKDVFDGFRDDVKSMRADMDRRFDRIESMMRSTTHTNGGNGQGPGKH